MTVGTLEHDALTVEQHPIVLQLELAETDFLPGHLYRMACIVQQLDFQFIQSRVLCTPQVGVLHRMAEQGRAAVQRDFSENTSSELRRRVRRAAPLPSTCSATSSVE